MTCALLTVCVYYICHRIACLLSLQRYNECLDMINEELESDNSNPDLYVFRAQLNGLFGNVSLLGYYTMKSFAGTT